MEKLNIQDFNILFICPSKKYGTLERRAIQDCNFFRNIGGNPVLYCLKDSVLELVALKHDIPTTYYSGKKPKSFFNLALYQDYKKLLKSESFNIVHAYHLKNIWLVSFFLLANQKIPLILTYNDFFSRQSISIWQKWLVKRVDQVVVMSKVIKESVAANLPIHPRKIKVLGAGVEFKKKKIIEKDNQRIFGSFIFSNSDLQNIKTIIHAIKGLMHATEDLGLDIKFHFYSFNTLDKYKDFDELRKFINQEQLAPFVRFEVTDRFDEVIKNFDIYISTSFNEPFNDYELMAQLQEIPVVMPRTSAREELICEFKWIGETYYYKDARELKDKVLKIILNQQVYSKSLAENHDQLLDRQGIDSYAASILSIYERIASKRLRFSAYKEGK